MEKSQHAPYAGVLQIVLSAADNAGDIVVTEALFYQFQLAVGTAEHRNVGKRAGLPLMAQGLGLQHVYASSHPVDLLGDENGLREAVRRLHQPDCGSLRTVWEQSSLAAGIVMDDRSRRL